MTEEDFEKIARMVKIYYPMCDNLFTTKTAVSLWYMQLQDIPLNVAMAVMNAWVSTHNSPPTVADIREMAADATNEGPIPDWTEQYAVVMKNIRRYGFYNVEEGLAALDGITRQTVERIGYTTMCVSETGTHKEAFRRIYTSLAERAKNERRMPEGQLRALESLKKRPEPQTATLKNINEEGEINYETKDSKK